MKAENKLVVVEEDPTKVSRLKSISDEKITQKRRRKKVLGLSNERRQKERELTNLL